MAETGDIVLTDLGEERPRAGLVMSNAQYHRRTGRALVAPMISGPVDLRPVPWNVVVDDRMYAVDMLTSLPEVRLLDRVGDAPYPAVMAARRALLAIT